MTYIQSYIHFTSLVTTYIISYRKRNYEASLHEFK